MKEMPTSSKHQKNRFKADQEEITAIVAAIDRSLQDGQPASDESQEEKTVKPLAAKQD